MLITWTQVNYLENLLYFYLGMQPGVDLCVMQSIYKDSLVSDVKNSPERHHIVCWYSKRPSVPCWHPSYLRECKSTVNYHTTFRQHLFEDKWPWGGFQERQISMDRKKDLMYRQKFQPDNPVLVNNHFSILTYNIGEVLCRCYSCQKEGACGGQKPCNWPGFQLGWGLREATVEYKERQWNAVKRHKNQLEVMFHHGRSQKVKRW